jgi:hypothetical protein
MNRSFAPGGCGKPGSALVAFGLAIAFAYGAVACGAGSAVVQAAPPAAPPLAVPTRYWLGEYFNNTDVAGRPALTRADRSINFNWGRGSPNRRIRADNFSVRWTRLINFSAGTYRFNVRMDDGARVFVDDRPILNAWEDGPARNVFADINLSGSHVIRVEYYERFGDASINLTIRSLSPQPSFPDWRGEYFNNPNLIGPPVLLRNDVAINFDWGNGSPGPNVPVDNFSARWTRTLSFAPGTYRFAARVDDGVRVFVNGRVIIDGWRDGPPRDYAADAFLSGSTEVRVEYYERGGGALIQFSITNIATAFPDWKGEYFNNVNLVGPAVLVRNDTAINFDWGPGSPSPLVSADYFSVRWTRRQFFNPGAYRITITVDDGMRVYVDNVLVLNEWFDGPPRTRTADINLTGGDHGLRVEYYERAGSAVAIFSIASTPPTPVPLPAVTPAP